MKDPRGLSLVNHCQNPKYFRQANEVQNRNQCNLIHTLRSAKQVDNQVSMPLSPIQASTSSTLTPPNSEQKDNSAEQVHKPIAPFRLRNNNNENMEKILEIFNQLKINLPLLEAIQQVSIYTKFLKDMCTKKRKINVPKKIFLATSYYLIKSLSSTRILVAQPFLAQ